jgi:hypothetical protein
VLVAALAAGCGRSGTGTDAVELTPTYIPQPTPDPTMAAVIGGNGPAVSFLPPLEVKGSPAPVQASRPAPTAGARRPTPRPAPTAREAAPREREPAPAPRPAAPTAVAPRPAPTAPRASTGSGAASANAGGGAPAVINPSTILPGSSVRPNPTPAR